MSIKTAGLVCLLLTACGGVYADDSMLGSTLDGRKIILHADGTWEFKSKNNEALREGIEVIGFDKIDILPDFSAHRLAKQVKLVLNVKNIGSKRVRCWKGTLVVKDVFDQVILRTPVTCNDVEINPGDTVQKEFVWEAEKFGESEIYEALAPVEKRDVKVALAGVRLVQ